MTATKPRRRTATATSTAPTRRTIERVQTGVRLEKRVLAVLKGLAAALDLSVGDLLEGIVLHAFEGKAPFSRATLQRIAALRDVCGLDLTAKDSHALIEAGSALPRPKRKPKSR